MKRLLTFLLTFILAIGVGWAAEKSYSLTPNQTSTGSTATSYITTLTEFTYDGVSWKMNQWNPKTLQIKTNQSSAASEFRFYNTSAFSGRITKVVITFSTLTVSDASKLMFLGGTSEVTATTGGTAGTWDSSAKTLTWTPGSSDNFTYFAFYQNGKAASGTNNLATSNAIVVTYDEDGGSGLEQVAAPVITAESPFYPSTRVAMSCETEGATIYYTTDGSDPTTESTQYSSSLTVYQSTTFKAIAVKEGMENSSVTTKEVLYQEQIDNIAAYKVLADGTPFKFTKTSTALYQYISGGRYYLYLQDDTGGALVFNSTGEGIAYSFGNIIPSGWTGTKTTYYNQPEVTNPANFNETEISKEPTAKELDITNVNLDDDYARYMVVKNVTVTKGEKDNNYTLTDADGNTLAAYTGYNGTVTDGLDLTGNYNVYGILSTYSSKPQLLPLKIEEVVEEETVAYYLTGNFNGWFGGSDNPELNEDYKFTKQADGSYVLAKKNIPDYGEFKILKVEGETKTWLGGETPEGENTHKIKSDWHTNIPLVDGSNFVMEDAGVATLTISTDQKLTVELDPQVYFTGDYNGWTKEPLTLTEGEGWITDLYLSNNQGFKFRNEWGDWYGGGTEVTEALLGTEIAIGGNGDNFVLSVPDNHIKIVVAEDLSKFVMSIMPEYHKITIIETEHGKVTSNPIDVALTGEKVTLTVTPDEGYELDELFVMNGNYTVDFTKVDDNTYTFVMPDAGVQITANFKEKEVVQINGYVKVTSTDDLTDGQYLIVYEGDTPNAFNGGLEKLDASGNHIDVTITDNVIEISNETEAAEFTIGTNAEGTTVTRTIKSVSGYYIGQTSDANGLQSSTTTAYANTISIDEDGNAIVSSGGAYLRFNANSGTSNDRYRYYKSGTYTQQKAIALYKKVGESTTVKAPVITGETPFDESTVVTITAESPRIYYTLDGNDPTMESTEYTEPFEITETTTVKAVAVVEGVLSAVTTKVFTKNEVTTVTTVAEMNALAKDTKFVFTGNAVVIKQQGNNIYIQDETAGALLYKVSTTYEPGEVIPANWGGTMGTFNDRPEVLSPTNFDKATETATLTAKELNLASVDLDADYARYMVANNVTIASIGTDSLSLTNEDGTILGYTKTFGITTTDFDKKYNVYGVLGVYKKAAQLLPLKFEEVVVPTYKITVADEIAGNVTIDVTEEKAGEEVEFLIEAPENYAIENVSVTGADGTAVEVELLDAEDNTAYYSFTMPAQDVTISATFALAQVSLEGVTFGDGRNWATWYDNRNLAVPEGITAYVVTAVTENVAQIEAVSYLPSGVGVLLYSDSEMSDITTTVYTDATGTAQPFSMLKGDVEEDIIDANNYVLYNNTFVRAQEETFIGAHRCYLPATVGAAAAVLRIGALPTAIQSILAGGNVAGVRYVNLQGAQSDTPWRGVNIVVVTLNDGTTQTMKFVK